MSRFISKMDTVNKEWNIKVVFITFYKFSVTVFSMKSKHKKFLSIPLAFTMMIGIVPSAETITIAEVPSSQPQIIAQQTVQGSSILHCFNWSFDEIKAHIPEIAAAGYTAVQTSPVQPPKDYNAEWTDIKGQWWKLYQPKGFRIAGENESWLGSAAELTELCTEAENYGIKVIVDVVANHLANNKSFEDFKKDLGGSFEGHIPYENLSPQVDDDMKNPDYYHTYFESAYTDRNYSKLRFTDTQYQAGMPDLNTGNSFVQTKVLDFLKSCVDCGVDGFRFDIAKHIELPTDDESFRSNFWPIVVNGVRDYAAEKNSELYIYGEVTDSDIGTNINNYTIYMAVTDDVVGKNARENVLNNNAKGLKSSGYIKQTAAENCVLWVESHDTYTDKVTSGISDENIVKTWAIIGSRADSTALFLARPNDTMGLASTDETWKSAAVAEVNKFKNIFNGQGEYLSSLGNTAYIERGTKGAVISKLDGAGDVRLNANKIVDGTYTDHVTGNIFTVSNGVISGNVGSSGVAVIYNENDITDTTVAAIPTKLYLDTNNKWKDYDARFGMLLKDSDDNQNFAQMFDSDGDNIYEASVPQGNWTSVDFYRFENGTGAVTLSTKKWNSVTGLDICTDGKDMLTITDWWKGDWNRYQHTHQFTGQPIWTWNGTSSAFAVFENCSICSKSLAAAAEITSELSGNIMTYTASVDFNGQTYTDIQQTEIESDITLYLNTGGANLWSINNPRFALYFVNESNEKTWFDMVKVSGQDYIYSCTVPVEEDYKYVVFCRMKDDPANDLTNRKNQTNNLAIPTDDNIMYTITEFGSGDDKISFGYWSAYTAPEPSEYTVTWLNYDGTVLDTTSVEENEIPVYSGETPPKANNARYYYTFSGWTPDTAAVNCDTTYTAQFTQQEIVYYLVGTFNDWQESDNYKFVLNFDENNIVEYRLENVTLSAGSQLKAKCNVNSKNTYFPKGGDAANYTVTADGTYNIYFRPDYNGGNSWYRNVLYFDNVTPYTVTFDSDNNTDLITQTVYYNETVTIPAEPQKYCYDFVGWYNGDTPYNFNAPVTSNLNLTAHWQEKQILITYTDVNGIDTVTSVGMANFSPETSFTLPPAPYLDGYNFGGWTVNGNSYNNKDDVLAQITSLVSDAANVHVQVVYTQRNNTYQLNVTNGIIRDEDSTEGLYKASEQMYVVADADDDSHIFSCWKASYNGGPEIVVGYERTYAFRMPSKSLTLKAYYVNNPEDVQEKSGTAYIESVSKPADNKLSFVSVVSVPKNAVIVKTGIIAQKAKLLGDAELTADNARYVRYNETTCTQYRSFKYTWTKGNVSTDDTWCVRSYLVYTQGDKEYTILSEETATARLQDFS